MGKKPAVAKLKPIITLSLFSGGGGMDLGFAAAGYSIKLAIDNDSYSCKTIELNSTKRTYLPGVKVLHSDITTISSDYVKEVFKGSVDAIIGGPPCQAFSVFGKRGGLQDPRGNLIWEYLRFVRDLKPRVFVFENVAGLKTIHNGEVYSRLLEALSCDGLYTVSDHNYEIATFGIPQFRSRIFFIGIRNGNRIPPMSATHGEPGTLLDFLPYVTVGKALRNLPEPDGEHSIPNHKGRVHSRRIIQRYQSLIFGERDHRTRINKLDPNRPSFTIIVGSDKGGGKGHIHPYRPREVTPRESARLQTFPDWWEFYGNGRHVIRQVGNAVPPLFASLLAAHIRKHVFKDKVHPTYTEFVDLLDLDYLK
jgi:DNA (cytosine-5)-methyltransferase 1